MDVANVFNMLDRMDMFEQLCVSSFAPLLSLYITQQVAFLSRLPPPSPWLLAPLVEWDETIVSTITGVLGDISSLMGVDVHAQAAPLPFSLSIHRGGLDIRLATAVASVACSALWLTRFSFLH